MRKTLVVLPDGTEISSGSGTVHAVQSCRYTQCVNSGTELTLGSVCAAMVELKLFTPGGGLNIRAGDRLTVYKTDETGARWKLGIFLAEKPTRPTANTMHITAYDAVSLLDRDLTGWLAGRSWPCTLYDLAVQVCAACGVALVNRELPNGSYLVPGFTAGGITGRQILSWIGQAAGRFCRADSEGNVEFAWYTPAPAIVNATGEPSVRYDPAQRALTFQDRTATQAFDGKALHLTAASVTATETDGSVLWDMGPDRVACYQGGMIFDDYQVLPIEKVQLRSNEADVGVIFPNTAEEVNTYRITGNPLLTGEKTALEAVAQALLQQLQHIRYTPCTLSVPAGSGLGAGQILTVIDQNGNTHTAYIMQYRQTGQRDTLSCTGSHRRDSTGAVNERTYSALSGKVLNLRTDVNGLRAENQDTAGNLASLALTVEGIRSNVSRQSADVATLRTDLTSLQQDAKQVKIDIRSMQENGASRVTTGASYTFDDNGLRIARLGEQIENRLDNTGMHVSRSGEMLLQATVDGVMATDVQVHNYLRLGDYARLEDYTGGRTACFYVGG